MLSRPSVHVCLGDGETSFGGYCRRRRRVLVLSFAFGCGISSSSYSTRSGSLGMMRDGEHPKTRRIQMRRWMSRQHTIVARMVRRVAMLRMRWRRMVRVLHHAPRSRIRLGRRGLVLVIFADCDVVYNRRTAKRVVVMMVVRGGIAEAGGAREVRGGFLHLPRRIALFDRSSAAVVVVGTGDCRDVRGIDGAVISRSGGFGS